MAQTSDTHTFYIYQAEVEELDDEDEDTMVVVVVEPGCLVFMVNICDAGRTMLINVRSSQRSQGPAAQLEFY